MACHYAAGIAALLKGAHTEWSPASIRFAIMTTASPFDNTQNYILDLGLDRKFAASLAMGAGQVKPNGALSSSLIYNVAPQDYINLLCSMNFTQQQIKTITRSSYNCSNQSSNLNFPSFMEQRLSMFRNSRGPLRMLEMELQG
ncbi:subtilisin-like protease [Olea europaea subsp. europaea]|uniref:Subtilisin-like protease n=1 Tax=Olea europaea subsp. europaea TaxID=158383 RepID=A0A8S0UP05_OLEEU|nr:subtilisin-like protease [Olea europaea subsp. europaea]